MGRVVAAASFKKAAQTGQDAVSVGVDLSNQPAYNLYQSLGFQTQAKLFTYTWKNTKI